MQKLLFGFCFLIISLNSFASHLSGGNISYECIGNNDYIIRFTMFEDCESAFETNGTRDLVVSNDCGFTGLSLITLNNTIYQEVISAGCSNQCDGLAPSYFKHEWEAVVSLPDPCNAWNFSYSNCCRAPLSNLVTNAENYYYEISLNNLNYVCNSTPILSGNLMPTLCVNQNFCFNLGATDPNGDLLRYSFVTPATSSNSGISFASGYSGQQPMPGIQIDSITGNICGSTSLIGEFVMAVKIDEIDSAGNFIGYSVHDFSTVILNCSNSVPDLFNYGNINNLSSNAIYIDTNSVSACIGSSIEFDLLFSDINTMDSLSFSTNIEDIIPNSVITYSYPNAPDYNEINLHINSNSNISGLFYFYINLNDNSCPINGTQHFTYQINIHNGTFLSAGILDNLGTPISPILPSDNVVICGGQSVQLNASFGTNFSWSVLNGDPINIGTNFSCQNCTDPISSPTSNTTYVVQSNLNSGCVNSDTITVFTTPDFNHTLLAMEDTICIYNQENINFNFAPLGSYNVNFYPPNQIDNNNSTYAFQASNSGEHHYGVIIEAPNGCIHTDSFDIYVKNSYAPVFNIESDVLSGFCGDTVNLFAQVNFNVNDSSGVNTNYACSNNLDTISIGAVYDTNSTTHFPAPFGNWYKNTKHQFLFTAAELAAMGMSAGIISGISWEVISINGTVNYNDYQVSIGQTSINALTTNFETGLDLVSGPNNIIINNGDNNITFDQNFYWNGNSNLIIEICYDNLDSNYTANSSTPRTLTTFNSSIYHNNDLNLACPATSGITSFLRPITSFVFCDITSSNNDHMIYDWQSTSSSFNDSLSFSPYIILNQTSTVEAMLTDTLNGCSSSNSITVEILCDTCLSSTITSLDLTCFNKNDGTISVVTSGIDGPFDIDILNPNNLNVIHSQSNIVSSTAFSALESGNYMVRTYDTTGCWSDTLVTITQPAKVTFNNNSSSSLCVDTIGSIEINPLSGVAPFTFSIDSSTFYANNQFDSLPIGVYKLQITDFDGCKSDIFIHNIFNGEQPQVIVNAITNSTCNDSNGSMIMINSTSFNSLSYSIDGGLNWSTNSYLFNLNGDYNVQVMTPEGCVADSTISIPNTGGFSLQTSPQVINNCVGDDVAIIAISDSSNLTYVWSALQFTYQETDSIFEAWSPSPTNHFIHIEATDTFGCTVRDSTEINTLDSAYAIITTDVPYIDLGSPINFSSVGSAGNDYSWDFGDGQTSTLEVIDYTYANVGNYTVILNVNNGHCYATDSINISVGYSNIMESYAENDFEVYADPNQIIISNFSNSMNLAKFKTYSLSEGKLIQSSILNSGVNYYATHDYANGIYIGVIEVGNKIILKKKITIIK